MLDRYTYHLHEGEYQPKEPVAIGESTDIPSYADIADRMQEGNESYHIARDPETGRTFSITVMNPGKRVLLFTSTSGSSQETNIGNFEEHAMASAADPDHTRVYVASPGLGHSSGFDRQERRHLRKTGRTTYGTGAAEDPFRAFEKDQALARVLDKLGLTPEAISADLEGGRFALGALAAIEPGAVRRVYLNNLPGVSDGTRYGYVMLREDAEGRRARAKTDKDELSVTNPKLKEMAKKYAPNIYDTHTACDIAAMQAKNVYNQATLYGHAFRGHNVLERPDDHAVLQDILAGLRRHEAIVSLQVNTESKLNTADGAIELGRTALNLLPEDALPSKQRGIQVLIGQGRMTEHTDSPLQRWMAERQALSGNLSLFKTLDLGSKRTLGLTVLSQELALAA